MGSEPVSWFEYGAQPPVTHAGRPCVRSGQLALIGPRGFLRGGTCGPALAHGGFGMAAAPDSGVTRIGTRRALKGWHAMANPWDSMTLSGDSR